MHNFGSDGKTNSFCAYAGLFFLDSTKKLLKTRCEGFVVCIVLAAG